VLIGRAQIDVVEDDGADEDDDDEHEHKYSGMGTPPHDATTAAATGSDTASTAVKRDKKLPKLVVNTAQLSVSEATDGTAQAVVRCSAHVASPPCPRTV
jgi:hypothetical protein